jgi:hypothetical protein
MPPYRVHADGRRLGKRPPKRDHRTLRLARYLTARLPAPPLAVDHSSRVLDWPMYANDELGICGPAGAAHQVQSWSTYAERGTITPPLQQVKDDYYAITGGADAGVYLLDMLNHWRRNGIGGDQIEAFVQVSPNLDEARLAVQLFGSLGMGLSLPDQGTFGPWDRLYGPPNPNNGHYVVGVRYADAERLLDVVTWGGILRMSYDFFLKYCVVPETRILTSDLEWVPAGDLAEGRTLLSFDEHGPWRRYKPSTVTGATRAVLPCREVQFADGTRIRCSRDHQWLVSRTTGMHWVRTDELRFRGRIQSRVLKPVDVWNSPNERDLGYLAAAFDGEGSLTQVDLKEAGFIGVARTQIAFAQKETSPMLAEVVRVLNARGLRYSMSGPNPHGMMVVTVTHRPDMLKLLGMARPRRLLPKFNPAILGAMQGRHRAVAVTACVDVGEQEVVVLSTSSKTYIAEGFASHNCDEAYAVLNDLSIVETTMRTPEGFNFDQLREDLDHLGDPVTPDPPPVEGRGVIAGWVHTSEMQPIPGATVSTAPSGFAMQTDAAGHYLLAVLPGAYAVSAVAAGYGPWTTEGIVVAEGDEVPLNFQLGPAGKGCNLLRA